MDPERKEFSKRAVMVAIAIEGYYQDGMSLDNLKAFARTIAKDEIIIQRALILWLVVFHN